MKKFLAFFVFTTFSSTAQECKIMGIGNYIIGDFTVKKLYHEINDGGLKVYSDPRDTNSKVDHIYYSKKDSDVKVYADVIDTNSQIESIEISDNTIFDELENKYENEEQKIELHFFHDTLFSIELYPTHEFKEAILQAKSKNEKF